MKYEDINNMDKSALKEYLGKEFDPNLSVAKLQAIAKGKYRQEHGDDETTPPKKPAKKAATVEVEVEDDAEITPVMSAESAEVLAASEPAKEETVTLSAGQLKLLMQRLENIERDNAQLRSQVTDRKSLNKEARQEVIYSMGRISDHYRHIVKEFQHYWRTGERKVFIMPRNHQTEMESWKTQKLIPCAPDGGLYWLVNREWQDSPVSGRKRGPIPFNYNLYIEHRIHDKDEAGKVTSKYMLVNAYGEPVKPFAKSLPMEDLDNGIPHFVKNAPGNIPGKPRQQVIRNVQVVDE